LPYVSYTERCATLRQMKVILLVLISIALVSCNISESKEEYFTRLTGLEIVESIDLTSKSENYLFNGDGHTSLIFQTSEKQMKRWISNSPPWSLSEWKRGIVDFEIGLHTNFGISQGNISVTTVNDSTFYSGSEKMISILTDKDNYYSYEERCCSERYNDLRFHNGTLLIINPNSKTVYLSIWDN